MRVGKHGLMRTRHPDHGYMALVLAAYLALGALYAIYTPRWQVPDEPAHYNYIRSLAEGRGLPVLEIGDYDQDLLSALTAQRFPPYLSVAALEYEDHQPPLYYLLATPVYWLSAGALLPLRLLTVVLGAALLLAAYATLSTLFPSQPSLALLATALIAFIPQHVAMAAGVNNDVLGELALAAVLWALVRYVSLRDNRSWIIGALLGVALLAKTTAYIGLGLAALAIALRAHAERRGWRWMWSQAARMAAPALLISAPWFLRNALTYGWGDLTGLARHSAVVMGQPRSSEWLMDYGWAGLLSRLLRTTFRSFWGQFGWMGVVLPARLYQGLALLSALALTGFFWWAFDRRRDRLAPEQRRGLALLGVSALSTALAFAWYNLSFVQHQGRYLFPALIPLGLGAALGLRQWGTLLPTCLRGWAAAALVAALACLDVVCLFWFVIPYLAR